MTLKIRPEQMQKFSDAALKRFEDKMTVHLQQFFPKVCSKLGAQRVRAVIQHGIRRSKEYGIRRERDVSRYIALMFMFGLNFDRKDIRGPLYRVLRDPGIKDAGARTRALCNAALTALQRNVARTGRKPSW